MIGDFFMRQSEAITIIDLIDETYPLIELAESKFKSAEDHGADLDYSENHFQELFSIMKRIIEDANEALEEEAA